MDTPDRPNLLMIVLDQLRYDSLGLTSGNRVHTPNLDSFAESGVQFENAFNHLPTCCPARQSLLTGRRPEAFGAHWNYDIALPIPSIVPDDETWTRSIAGAGYRSSYFGKWHVSPDFTPVDFGYDRYLSQDDYEAFRAQRYPGLEPADGWQSGVDPVDLEDAETHWFAGRASQEIASYASESGPWHVRLDLVQPHLPCRPVAEFAELYAPDDIEPWPSFGEDFALKPYIQRQQLASWGVQDWTWKEWSEVVARYFGVISQVDDALGGVLAAVRDSGQQDNTLIVFTTDHGDMCGAHRMMDKHFVLYDDVHHVPLIAAWPGKIAPGSTRSEMVYNILDLVPTITEALGLPALPEAVGRSLWPLMEQGAPAEEDAWRDYTVATYNGQQFGLYTQRSIRTADWKYVWNATDTDELYDLRRDPAELRNLIGEREHTEELAGLRRRLYETLIREGDRQVDNVWVRSQLLAGAIV